MTVIANMECGHARRGCERSAPPIGDHFRDTTKMVSGGIWWKSRTARESGRDWLNSSPRRCRAREVRAEQP